MIPRRTPRTWIQTRTQTKRKSFSRSCAIEDTCVLDRIDGDLIDEYGIDEYRIERVGEHWIDEHRTDEYQIDRLTSVEPTSTRSTD